MKRWPLVILAVLLVATALVYWPRSDAVDLPPPLTLAQAQALPDEGLALALAHDVSGRLLRTGQAEAWRSLPEPARHFWVATTVMPEVVQNGFLTFLVVRPDPAPGLAEAAAACTALGAVHLAAVCDEAGRIAAAAGAQAVAACRAHVAREHAPPVVRPPGFSDPFAALDARLAQAVEQDGLEQRSLAFAKRHLAAILQGRAAP